MHINTSRGERTRNFSDYMENVENLILSLSVSLAAAYFFIIFHSAKERASSRISSVVKHQKWPASETAAPAAVNARFSKKKKETYIHDNNYNG